LNVHDDLASTTDAVENLGSVAVEFIRKAAQHLMSLKEPL